LQGIDPSLQQILAHLLENRGIDFSGYHPAMLERRVSKTAVRGYIDANKEVPPGITYGTKLDINIRKPTAR